MRRCEGRRFHPANGQKLGVGAGFLPALWGFCASKFPILPAATVYAPIHKTAPRGAASMAEEADGQDTGTEASGAGVDPAAVALAFNHTSKIAMALRKMVALLFLIAIALVPFVIVVMYSREGGVWVLGYVTGIITVPVVGIAAIQAMNTLSNERAFIGTVVFGFIVILISFASGLWSLSR